MSTNKKYIPEDVPQMTLEEYLESTSQALFEVDFKEAKRMLEAKEIDDPYAEAAIDSLVILERSIQQQKNIELAELIKQQQKDEEFNRLRLMLDDDNGDS